MNVPKLRFKKFSGEWEEKTLEQLATVERGKFSVRPRNDPKYFGGNIPFVQTGDVVASSLYLKKFSQTLNDEGLKVSKIFPKNTVLITIAANIGDTTVTEFDVACTDSVVGIQPFSDKANVIWLKHSIDLKKEELDSKATQNAQKNINLQILKPLILQTPSLSEQTKIASFLTAIDEKIAQLTQKHTLINQYKKGMMQQIFSQQLRFKGDNGEEFGAWEEKALGEIFAQRTERAKGGEELLSVTINSGVKKFNDLDRKDNSSQDKSNYLKVFQGDIVYNSMRMWQGASGIANWSGIVSPAYTVLVNNNKVNNVFFSYLFKLSKMIFIFQKHSQGLTSDTWNLKYSKFSKIKVFVPSLIEQTKIANFLSSIDQKINQVTAQLDAAKQYKRGLLQQMFV